MHSYDLIFTLAGGLSAALVLGYFTQRLGLSPLVGYLLAGVLVGPHTPGFVADASLAEQLAEIGVILLMFGVGLQFHVEELLAVRRVAIPGAIAQSAVATGLGMALAHAMGWTMGAGFIFGLALAVASTVVLVRVLADFNDLHTQAGHIAVGWLVVEDVFTVIALVLIPAVLGSTSSESSLWSALGITFLKVAALLAFTIVVGTRVIPGILDHIAGTRSRELFTLSVLAIALGIAAGSAVIFSVSMALGAFLAGMVVGRSDYSLRAASEALPMRDAFAVLFFVSVGMLLDPVQLISDPLLTLGALGIVLIGKPAVALVIVRALRYPFKTALTVAIALGQIGEFSFILSTIGRDLGILSPAATNALVATSIVSIIINPLLYRSIDPICAWLATHPRLWAALNPSPELASDEQRPPQPHHPDPSRTAVVIGYGPTGRTVVRLLRDNEIRATVIELNMDTVRTLRETGVDAVYGDATHQDTLTAAGIEKSGALILGSAGMANSAEVIRMARSLNPKIKVLARTTYLREVAELRSVGATAVYSGEGEIALAFIEDILGSLGATAEQIDRERARAHKELFLEAEADIKGGSRAII
jgi:CPA2 family monovalent cation:H+ antiporter-2